MGSSVVTKNMLEDLERSLSRQKTCASVEFFEHDRSITGYTKPQECRREAQKLITALEKISPDAPRGIGHIFAEDGEPAEYWLGVIWAIAGLDWKLGKKIARKWSRASERYSDEGFKEAWNSYDPNHPRPIGIRSVYLLAAKLEGKLTKSCSVDSPPAEGNNSPLAVLNSFSLTGSSAQMKKQMLDDVFVMDGLAIVGQWTTLYAAPNTGKTLLTLAELKRAILAGTIEGKNVFYVNADDTYRGAVHKIELAEQWGMKMLVPGHNDFKASLIPVIMEQLAEAGEAKGVVLVLDTLKKFTDLMDKSAATAFGVIAREFVSAGGTLICLAHTNKHKDADGKGIYSGTSDIVDDSDCMFVIDKLSAEGDDYSKMHTVEFTNKKARGDVSSSAIYTYEKRTGEPYSALLDSVSRVENTEIDAVKQATERRKLMLQDAEVIQIISNCITKGIFTKSELIKSAMLEADISKQRAKAVLERWTGEDYEKGYRWSYKAGDHNRFSYSLNTPPSKS